MRIWVTRTEPGATRLAAALSAQGFDPFRSPVLRIAPTASPPPPGPFDIAVFVSEHAVRHGWRPGLAAGFAAIGEAARSALERSGAKAARPALRNAADAIAAFEPAPPARTLIVKGEGGREALQRWLRARGRAVADWNVYRRVATPDQAESLAGQRVDAIVASSGEGLRLVAKLWFAQQRPAVVPLLVPSERVAGIARAAGFANVRRTAGASAPAVLAVLQTLEGAERESSHG